MKNLVKYMLILPPLLIAQWVAAVTYPSKQGAKVERSFNSETTLQLQKNNTSHQYRAVSPKQYASPATAGSSYSGSGLRAGSDASLNSYGGSSATGAAIASGRSSVSVMPSGGYSGGIGSVRVKSVAKGSMFESTEMPVMASGYEPDALRAGGGPPPPHDDENDPYNQLPLGNGIWIMLLLSGAFCLRKKVDPQT